MPPVRKPPAKVTYSLPDDLREWARKLAFDARLSESAIVETALRDLREQGDQEVLNRARAYGLGLRRK
ncbi:MAG: hypothetical protein ACYCX6_00045 [Vulcanimicrobiaceae bacterium]